MHRLKKAAGSALAGATIWISTAAAVFAPGAAWAQNANQTVNQGQGKLAGAAPVTYANKYEIYAGLNFMNFQAGQFVTERVNLGGVEVLGTYWLTHRIGLGLDFRGDAGDTPTTPVINEAYKGRPVVYLLTGMGGVQYRFRQNQHAALNFHGYGGMSHGVFDVTTTPAIAQNQGLYANETAPIFAVGASLDFNRSKRLAIRLQPDLILEHFGTGTREFFSISGGVVYRIGKK